MNFYKTILHIIVLSAFGITKASDTSYLPLDKIILHNKKHNIQVTASIDENKNLQVEFNGDKHKIIISEIHANTIKNPNLRTCILSTKDNLAENLNFVEIEIEYGFNFVETKDRKIIYANVIYSINIVTGGYIQTRREPRLVNDKIVWKVFVRESGKIGEESYEE